MNTYEKELKSMILEDMERLKEDVTELIKDRKQNKYSELKSGIICPKCNNICKGNKDTRIKDGYRVRDKTCLHCGRKWRTVEIIY